MRKAIFILLFLSAFISCRNSVNKDGIVAINNSDYASTLHGRASQLSELEFEGKITIEQFADTMDILLTNYRDSVSLVKFGVRVNDNFDIADEFVRDTLWLNHIHHALYSICLAQNSYQMIQANKYVRVVKYRMVEKYYNLALSVSNKPIQKALKTAYDQWKKSIEADYETASAIVRGKEGTISLHTWPDIPDDMLIERANYYLLTYRDITD